MKSECKSNEKNKKVRLLCTGHSQGKGSLHVHVKVSVCTTTQPVSRQTPLTTRRLLLGGAIDYWRIFIRIRHHKFASCGNFDSPFESLHPLNLYFSMCGCELKVNRDSPQARATYPIWSSYLAFSQNTNNYHTNLLSSPPHRRSTNATARNDSLL